MKFGKEFRTHLEETLPEWRDKFLCYKHLKKLLKQLPNNNNNFTIVDFLSRHPSFDFNRRPGLDLLLADVNNNDNNNNNNLPLPLGGGGDDDLQHWFIRILSEELEKFNDFYVEKEEDFVICLQELKEKIERVKEKSRNSGVPLSESEFSDEMMDIRKDFVTIHGEMVLLKNYSSLNFAGLVKILKKYDKRTGGLLQLPFTQLALQQPFFMTEPLTRLVHECESNLEVLFPLEAEVIESNPCTRGQSNLISDDKENAMPETSSTGVEETMDVYRSTLAAMKAIRGLRKESSTSNPLSFSSYFKRQDGSSPGSLTSASNSSGSLQDVEGGAKDVDNKDDADSGSRGLR
ncbi:hypothetical protein ACFE04_005544 [Oxalis oulophora]